VRILATAPLRGPGLEQLRRMGEVIEEPWITGPTSAMTLLSDEQLAERVRAVEAEVVICEADSVKAATLALPLRAVGSTRGDPTNVDLAEATARGVPVLRAPGRNADGVAELAVALALACTRGLVAADADVRAGQVYRDGTIPYQRFRSWQLAGRTVGLVGFGAVGRAAAWRFAGLGMRVLSHDPFAPDASHPDLDSMLAESDVVSVHAAVTPETVGLLSAERFARMPAGAVFVNTARAALHDLDALTAALASGHLGAAGLDHFEGEAIATDHPLVGMANVVLTPHIGGATFDTEANHTQAMADGLAMILDGKRPPNLANPDALARWP
jgi:D-3-phosphoglycerate dehydrogenase / 2-oxoglutarate reductase